MMSDIDSEDPFRGRRPTMARLWNLRQQWQEQGHAINVIEARVEQLQRRHGLKWPRMKQQQRALDLISKNEPRTKTKQGFGTGAGKRKGSKNKITHRVREVIAAADKAINDGETLEEVTRRLATVGLLEPSVFREVMKHRRIGVWGVPPRGVELIREQEEPKLSELAEFARLPVDVMQRLKRANSDFYKHMREAYIKSRMTAGEQAVLEAVQHVTVKHSIEEQTGQPYKPRKPRRDIGKPRPHYRRSV